MTRSIYNHEYRLLLALLMEVRDATGTTQAALAARLGNTQSYVSKCERGERRLDVMELIRWCEALGVDPAALMKGFLACRNDPRTLPAVAARLLRKSSHRKRSTQKRRGRPPA